MSGPYLQIPPGPPQIPMGDTAGGNGRESRGAVDARAMQAGAADRTRRSWSPLALLRRRRAEHRS